MNIKDWCKDNWYYLKDKIDFEWDRYWDWIPSITSILQLIWDPWFEFVMKKYGDKVKESAIKWTKEHSNAEQFFNPKSWVTNINKNFMMFHVLYNVNVIETEKTIYKDWIRWTIDLIWEIKWKWIYNIDYKNTNKHSLKYCLQLWWYKFLNWNPWVLVYWKWKLNVKFVEDFYKDLFIELKNYFFYLLNK